MQLCKVPEPPTETALLDADKLFDYQVGTWEARTLLLANYNAQVLFAVGECNVRIEKLLSWIAEQKDIEVANESRRGAH